MLASSNDHIKIELPSLRITWNLAEQKSYNQGYKEEVTSRLIRGVKMWNEPVLHHVRWLKLRRGISALKISQEE